MNNPFYSTLFSSDGRYRYRLYRDLSDLTAPQRRPCAFVMLNPSTADGETDDSTVRRCSGFARAWGCTDLFIVNLFAIVGTDPAVIRSAPDPVGPHNHHYVGQVARFVNGSRGPVVCAWGAKGGHLGQAQTMVDWLKCWGVQPHCLRITGSGYPEHPLYLPKDLTPIAYVRHT